MASIAQLCVLAALATFAAAEWGVDVSQPTSTSSFQCMRNQGAEFAIVRAWESIGQFDSAAPGSVAAAHAAGIPYVDVYMFPCPSCGNPTGQMANLVNDLKSHGVSYGMIWLDIEGPQYWSSDKQANINFISGLISQAKAMGVHLGIYTSESQWIPITGGSTIGAGYALWYAHYDGAMNFNDFSAFGGWTKPSIKQYQGTTSMCGAGVDLSWYP
eukprot:TRINITY_DN4290_c0_g1_i2.p1 TRINITY_DN4290_c0_g1~~TRINITY_DN4290_c0_g1_i2.p1  ORF type:complete len:214 (-),score=80.96 TRINITY_DN4290_c0_g1_i2:160-801(-)